MNNLHKNGQRAVCINIFIENVIKDRFRASPKFQTSFGIYFSLKQVEINIGINIYCAHIFGFLKNEGIQPMWLPVRI